MRKPRVLIAGAGPAGLTASLILGSMGIQNVVFERRVTPSPLPQAHYISSRTQEILSPFVNLAPHATPSSLWSSFVYTRSLSQQPISIRNHTAYINARYSPYPPLHLSQNRVVPLLLDAVRKSASCDLRMGVNITGYRDMGSHSVIELEGGEEESGDVVIAADGASSVLRQILEIPLDGSFGLQELVNVHFTSKRLALYLKDQYTPGMLYFIYNPSMIGILVAHNLETGEFACQIPYFPPQQDISEFTPEKIIQMFQESFIPSISVGLTIHDISSWSMNSVVAKKFGLGRAFLVGDSAHQFPPAGGFGMNCGIQDVHNLCWKLHKSFNSPHISLDTVLNSYNAERRHVAQRTLSTSFENFFKVVKLAKVLGLDPSLAKRVHKASSLLPTFIGKPFLNTSLGIGRLRTSWLSPSTLSTFDKLVQNYEGLELVFPEMDLLYHLVPCGKMKLFHFVLYKSGSNKPISSMGIINSTSTKYFIFAKSRTWETVVKTDSENIVFIGEGFPGAQYESEDISKYSWNFRLGIGDAGAALIRPDGFIAWKGQEAGPEAFDAIRGIARQI